MSDIFDIHEMSEEDIKHEYITTALEAKWDAKKISMETEIWKAVKKRNQNLHISASPLNNFTDGKSKSKETFQAATKENDVTTFCGTTREHRLQSLKQKTITTHLPLAYSRLSVTEFCLMFLSFTLQMAQLFLNTILQQAQKKKSHFQIFLPQKN